MGHSAEHHTVGDCQTHSGSQYMDIHHLGSYTGESCRQTIARYFSWKGIIIHSSTKDPFHLAAFVHKAVDYHDPRILEFSNVFIGNSIQHKRLFAIDSDPLSHDNQVLHATPIVY